MAREKSNASIKFKSPDGTLVDYLPPKTPSEVKKYCELFFGIILADKPVCKGHSSPLEAFCAAYFSESPVVVWRAARAAGGKSTSLAALGMLDLLRGADVVVLGGSGRQSQRVHEVETVAWNKKLSISGKDIDGPFKHLLVGEPTGWYTKTKAGNTLTAIPASQKSARGLHPQKLFIDEADELELDILDASLGQPMARPGIPSQVVISSTLQYVDGTMAEVLRRAAEKKFRRYDWCWREAHVNNGGWLTEQMIQEMKLRMPERMFKLEVELGEPNIEGRIFSEETIEKVFGKPRKGQTISDRFDKICRIEKPEPGARYSTGVDWGKDVDPTTVVTFRYDCIPARLVAYEKHIGHDWGIMQRFAEERVREYPGILVHDGIQLGSVIQDYFSSDIVAFPFDTRGERRYSLYGDYTIAMENASVQIPKLESLKKEHEYVTYDDLYTPRGHVPDGFAACALAWAGVLGKAVVKVKNRPISSIGKAILWR